MSIEYRAESQVSKRATVLMCPPHHYAIAYEINPWMSLSRPSHFLLACKQWRTLYHILKDRLTVNVCLIEPVPGLPDMVFTANAGFAWGDKFIVSNFRHKVRRQEATHFENWFCSRNYEILHLPKDRLFEGEGDLLTCGNFLFAGYPFRSSLVAHRRTAEILQREVFSLKLACDWFYHLDTCFCPLDNKTAIYYPAAFDRKALKLLEKYVDTLIAVSEEEARRFACNAIVVSDNVIMNDGCPKIRRQLESRGFFVFQIPLTEFVKAGGSAKCLVLNLPHCGNPN
jgi:N-dimethylarginine dimethylaminohydrolase